MTNVAIFLRNFTEKLGFIVGWAAFGQVESRKERYKNEHRDGGQK